MAGRVLEFVTLGILLASATFAVLALNFAWGQQEVEAAEITVGYRATDVRQSDGDDAQHLPYSGKSLDEFDGIGMTRAGGVLFLIGAIMVGLAALVAEHRLLLGQGWLAIATTVTAGVAMALLVVGSILLPIGISELSSDPSLGLGEVDLTWMFGFYAGIAAGAAALAATVMSVVTVMRTVGFKLDVAEGGAADFDA